MGSEESGKGQGRVRLVYLEWLYEVDRICLIWLQVAWMLVKIYIIAGIEGVFEFWTLEQSDDLMYEGGGVGSGCNTLGIAFSLPLSLSPKLKSLS